MELIKGQCETCGEDYELTMLLPEDGNVACPVCKQPSQNWDTPEHPQMAPYVVTVMKGEDERWKAIKP